MKLKTLAAVSTLQYHWVSQLPAAQMNPHSWLIPISVSVLQQLSTKTPRLKCNIKHWSWKKVQTSMKYDVPFNQNLLSTLPTTYFPRKFVARTAPSKNSADVNLLWSIDWAEWNTGEISTKHQQMAGVFAQERTDKVLQRHSQNKLEGSTYQK